MAVNKQMEKTPMPEQEARVRAGNFEEVALGYTEEMALNEAARCLNCKHRPCVSGCPVNVAIPDFIARIAEQDYEEAYNAIARTSSLPAVCGRVCPQETQCEAKCVRGIKGEPVAIGRLAYAEGGGRGEKAGFQRPPGGGGGLRPSRPDLRGGSGQARL